MGALTAHECYSVTVSYHYDPGNCAMATNGKREVVSLHGPIGYRYVNFNIVRNNVQAVPPAIDERDNETFLETQIDVDNPYPKTPSEMCFELRGRHVFVLDRAEDALDNAKAHPFLEQFDNVKYQLTKNVDGAITLPND